MPGVGYLNRVFQASEEANRRAVLAALPARRGGDILDVGTHRGDFTMRLADHLRADSVSGVELIERHAAVARSRGIDVVVGDLDEGIPFPSASFDVVHANQVIEHVRRTDLLLREIRRVLRPGGVGVHLDEQPVELAQRGLAGARPAAHANPRERRDHRGQPAQPREPLGPPRPRPHAPAALHRARASRAGRASRSRSRDASRPSATTRCRR